MPRHHCWFAILPSRTGFVVWVSILYVLFPFSVRIHREDEGGWGDGEKEMEVWWRFGCLRVLKVVVKWQSAGDWSGGKEMGELRW